MPPVIFDLTQEVALLYPQHGWAYNSQHIKILWFPILRFMRNADEMRKSKGIESEVKIEDHITATNFNNSLYKLIITLREIHKLIRLYTAANNSDDESAGLKFYTEHMEMLPLYIDLSFAYFRRIADRLAEGLRLIVFEKYGVAPVEYKKLREFILSDKLYRAKPIVDTDILRNAFQNHSAWFDELRTETLKDGIITKGIRDAIEHRPVGYQLGAFTKDDGSWESILIITSPKPDVPTGQDVIASLKRISYDFSLLISEICRSVKSPNSYSYFYDILPITGDDEDITGFWPKIKVE